jgi:SAM-dependent methyltransferase
MLGDAVRFPLMSASVDAVTMVWLLHLLDHAASASALAEAGRVLRPGGLLITTVGKGDAAYSQADDAAAIVRPVRARFDHDQTDSLDRVRDIGRRHGLDPAAQTTFTGLGQGLSPRRWRKLLQHDQTGWTAAAGRERLDAVCAALKALPEQDRSRPDPVYRLVALRKEG